MSKDTVLSRFSAVAARAFDRQAMASNESAATTGVCLWRATEAACPSSVILMNFRPVRAAARPYSRTSENARTTFRHLRKCTRAQRPTLVAQRRAPPRNLRIKIIRVPFSLCQPPRRDIALPPPRTSGDATQAESAAIGSRSPSCSRRCARDLVMAVNNKDKHEYVNSHPCDVVFVHRTSAQYVRRARSLMRVSLRRTSSCDGNEIDAG